MMLRFGVVGTSWITRSMIAGAQRYPDLLRLTAVCSRSEERGRAFAAEYGATAVFTDPADMAASDELDFVYIASPNRLHIPQSRLFLEAGKSVLCEKPLSADPDEVAALQTLAAQKGLLFREAIMMLYQPSYDVLREAMPLLGTLSTAQFQFCQLSSKYEELQSGKLPNIFNPALHAGCLMDLGVYCVYPTLALFGEPTGVSAQATLLPCGADRSGVALMYYPDKQVILTYSKIGQGTAPSEIIGDGGSITVGSVSRMADITLHLNGQPERVLAGSDDKPVQMGREIASFARSLEAGERMGGEKERLALSVSRWMKTIRDVAGIRFPQGDEQ